MTRQEDAATAALARLRARGVPLDVEQEERLAPRMVDAIERAMKLGVAERRASQRRAVWTVVAVTAFGAAAATALVVGATRETPADARLTAQRGSVAHLRQGASELDPALRAGDAVHTGTGGDAVLTLPHAAQATLGADGSLALEQLELRRQSLRLDRGHAHFDLPPVSTPRELVVSTAFARVTVLGTVFDVWSTTAERGGTRVRVTRGRVVVSAADGVHVLGAGEEWRSHPPQAASATAPTESATAANGSAALAPSAAVAPATSSPALVTAARATAISRATAPATTPALAKPVAPTTASTLAAENALFQAALAARDAGDTGRARSTLEDLLRRYPASPLAPAARVELARLAR